MWGFRLWGQDRAAEVTSGGALKVAIVENDVPSSGTQNKFQYITGLLGENGLAVNGNIVGNNTSMNVDGSASPVDFTVTSAGDYDLYITCITILITDGAISLSKFGALAALANGFNFTIHEGSSVIDVILDAKTGGDIVAQAGAQSWEIISNYVSNDDGLFITIPIFNFLPEGIRIGRGTLDKMVARVSDDLEGLTDFNVRIFGYKHIIT